MNRKDQYSNIQNLSDKEKNLHYYAAYRERNPERMIWRAAKSRAAKRGVEFDIEISDIVIPSHCPVLGILLKKSAEVGGQQGGREDSPSLDRINNDLGYVKGNVQVISNKANSMKFTASPEELVKFATWVMKEYK